MELRRYGEDPRLEAREEANKAVDRQKRYRQILDCLEERGASTAKEIAVWLCLSGYVPSSERNYVSPRLTELGKAGIVEPLGKKRCIYTGRTVTVWHLCKDDYGNLERYCRI